MRPNILLITSDQQRGDCFGFEGRALKTPHLDLMAQQGTRFSACITPNNVCQPARASILTGLLPLTHGAWDNGVDLDPKIGAAGFGGQFSAAGYATGFIGKGTFSLVNLGDVSNLTQRQIEDASIAAGITRFRRPEDSAWDPRNGEKHRNDAYFVTTADVNTNCRLWRLRFDDIRKNPEKGGTIEILLTGSEGHRMLDNVTIDPLGRIVMDEDPGNNSRVSKIWLYQIATGEFVEVAHHNPKFFDPTILNNSSFITQDEESSGIIDASDILGDGWFLLDVQAHKVNTGDPELVEGGQLLAMFIDPRIGAGKRGKKNDEDED